MKNLYLFSHKAILVVAGLFLFLTTNAQTPNEAEWNGYGYSLKKVVSNTSIQSGVTFSYTIMFSAPAGTSTIDIVDLVPSSLGSVSVSPPAPVLGVTPTVSITPSVSPSGTNVSYLLTGLPSGLAISGSFTITVQFPPGITCNGTTARNRAGIFVNDKWHYTPYVSTVAEAVSPWKITKTILNGAVVNPNPSGCGYLIPEDGTVTYRIYVNKENIYWGNNIGQENMTSASVTDIFPSGATFTSSCFTPSPGSGTATWNIGTLDAANPFAFYYCDVTVNYPAGSFPNGTTITNEATVSGVVCNQPESITSNQTCIEVADITPNPGAFFKKYLTLTNKVPGCQGYYRIYFCNNGNVDLAPFNISDVIPGGITVDNIVIYGGDATTTMNLIADGTTTLGSGINTSSFNTGPLSTSPGSLELQMTGSLPVGECIYMYIYFTIDANPTGTVIENCADFIPLSNSPFTLPQTCVSFTVEAGEPVPCLIKDVCDLQASYDPGDIVRFRLRVQNIGSDHLVGASIQDVLNSSFTHIPGSESYYVYNGYNPPCASASTIPAGAFPWSGVSASHSGNNLSWTLPDIPADCQLFYNAYCGTYGTSTLPYYYIEFDAQVNNTALVGVTPNNYEISGGNLTGPVTSNTVYVLIEASFGQEVYKEISVNNGANYFSSASTSAGSNARYRLNYTNVSNVPVQEVEMVDLLPINNLPTSDLLVLNRAISRGSTFDVNYAGSPLSTQLPTGTPTPLLIDFSSDLNICLLDYGVTTLCNTPSWSPSPSADNVRINWGTYLLDPLNTMQHAFDILVSPNAQLQQVACNDFAAKSKAAFLLDGVPQLVALTPIAAPPVCLDINTIVDPDISCCDSIQFIPVQNDPTTDLTCCILMRTKCEVKYIDVEVMGGTIGAASWSCGPLPPGFAGQSSFLFPANGCAADLQLCIDPDYSGPISINYTILFSNGEQCERTVNLDCVPADINCCDSVELTADIEGDKCCAYLTSDCNVKAVTINATNGVLSSTSWNCGPVPSGYDGMSSFTFLANNCPIQMTNCVEAQQSGPVYLDYILYFENGDTCHQRIELDCILQDNCCENTKLVPVEDKECCARLVTACEVKSLEVEVMNGTLSDVQWNCTTSPSGYAGLSSYTFAPNNCALDMTTCVNATSAGPVTLTYLINFTNGEQCEQIIDLDCEMEIAPPCCALVDFKLKHIWPQWGNMAGTFNITNLDPASPICGVSINASPSGSFTTGNLYVDGVMNPEPWTSTMIPASGNLSTPAVNDLSFTLVSSGYKGVIEICVIKCDGTKCCFEYKWNKKPWIAVELELEEKTHSEKLSGTIVSPDIKEGEDVGKVKYISFGIANDSDENTFFAISGADLEGGKATQEKAEIASTYMGAKNAFFELRDAKMADEMLGDFNLVFTGELPDLGCTLFDEEGNIIYTGIMELTGTDSVHTSIKSASLQQNMFEVLKLYPNPTQGTFNINFALGEISDIEVHIATVDGRTIKVVPLNSLESGIHDIEVNLGDISPGLYHVTLYSDGHKLSRSLVVK